MTSHDTSNARSSDRALRAALAYAQRGWKIVPLHTPSDTGRCSCGDPACPHGGKHPRFHPRDCRQGVYSASGDPAQICAWWRRWPDANIGIATGIASRLVVADIDDRAYAYDLPSGSRVMTARGEHVYMAHPGGVVHSSVRLLPGLDIRGEKTLVVAPPSLHSSGVIYRWVELGPPAPVPGWLRLQIQHAFGRSAGAHGGTPSQRVRRAPLAATRSSDPPSPAYAQAVFARELQRLRATRAGQRNTTLNWVAFRCGQFLAIDLLEEAEVVALLTAAARSIGLGAAETRRTIASGVRGGRANAPWTARV